MCLRDVCARDGYRLDPSMGSVGLNSMATRWTVGLTSILLLISQVSSECVNDGGCGRRAGAARASAARKITAASTGSFDWGVLVFCKSPCML